ncbi:hypothetical protein N182_09900 [Sinorhizobium sp. GL2]|nr:hypothetical protein N182_09900 [Sinorhizobium sp. GL2]
MRQHQEQRAARRFLEDLQDGVGRIAIEIVGRIDDDDAPIARAGGLAEELAGAPDLVDGDRPLRPARLFIDRAGQVQEIV